MFVACLFVLCVCLCVCLFACLFVFACSFVCVCLFVCPTTTTTAQMLREERKSYTQGPSPGRERIHGLYKGVDTGHILRVHPQGGSGFMA